MMSAEPFSLFGRDLFGNPVSQRKSGPLAERFEFPPFSVLDARGGEWQERKRSWISLGIQSEVGRPAELQSTGKGSCYGGTSSWADQRGGAKPEEGGSGGASIFDPVLAELAYRWFCPPGGQVLDPFAGGSVRGVVASLLGFQYWGSDLRPEQVAANREQASAICGDAASPPAWECGDCLKLVAGAPRADLVFSCPPYGDLERYSDDPADLSTMDYPAFLASLEGALELCAWRLKDDRFLVLVVGDFRDKRGNLRGFPGDTVTAARKAGLSLYNEAILMTSVGSLPIRVGKQFAAGRKLGKTHQNLLVFVKGDGRKAADAVTGAANGG